MDNLIRPGAASFTESAGVFTQAASLSVPLKWASTSPNPATPCRFEPTLPALFFQAAQVQ